MRRPTGGVEVTKIFWFKASWPKTSNDNRTPNLARAGGANQTWFGHRRVDFEVFGHEALI